MSGYNTEQKKILTDFLKKHKDESFTIEEIYEHISARSGAVPGLSTLYRLMPKLAQEGKVKRFAGSGKRRFLYQIVDGEQCEAHLHMKCTKCGKLLHMSDGLSEALLEEIQNRSKFSVDRGQTVLFGKCAACKNSEESKK